MSVAGTVIVDLTPAETRVIDAIADFLPGCFEKYSPEWLPDRQSCLDQLHASFESGRRSRVAMNEHGEPVGWIAAITDAHTWEIHPLAVSPAHQGEGLGRRLVADIEALALAAGAVSVWAGTGDETGSTSFAGVDLYRDAARAFESINAPADHPLRFWLSAGYRVVGVLPDEEGLGKPGIHLARRIVAVP